MEEIKLSTGDETKPVSVTVHLDSEALSKLVEDGVKGLPQDAVCDIVRSALSAAMKDKETINRLLFVKTKTYSGWDESEIRPWVVDLLSKSFTEDEVKMFSDDVLKVLHSDHRSVVVDAMTKCFSDVFFGSIFRSNVEMVFREIQMRDRNYNS